MPVKQYGIYLCFPPKVDLRHEGLGRYLASFLGGATDRTDARFVVVAPSWSRERLEELLIAEGIPTSHVKIRTPNSRPVILRLYDWLDSLRRRRKTRSTIACVLDSIAYLGRRWTDAIARRLAGTSSLLGLLPLTLEGLLFMLVILTFTPVIAAFQLWRSTRRMLERSRPLTGLKRRLARLLNAPDGQPLILRLYQYMQEAEATRMQRIILHLADVRAWYCPTAFWPAFNNIVAPRLMCLPDVVFIDFPVSFALTVQERGETAFREIENAIRSGCAFVTYSETVKRHTLVERYGVAANAVTVVQHAPQDLSRWLVTLDSETAPLNHCEKLLVRSIQKSTNPRYTAGFMNSSVGFLFYASQFRPNKNIITLLRAYEYLLRKQYFGHKLLLTGHPAVYSPVQEFIQAHNLANDVLCLHGLNVQELAACYKLAQLAVNPSLSEGGFPFTFTEALSVRTPVVMSRISVTEEVVTDPDLQNDMLFDPYDWRDVAARIEWALANRDSLLTRQEQLYSRLAKRTWSDVVKEHIAVLDRLAVEHSGAVTRQ